MTTQVPCRPFSTELPCSGLEMLGRFLATFPSGGTGHGPIMIPSDGMAKSDHLRTPERLFCPPGAHFRQKTGLFDLGTPPPFRGGTTPGGGGTTPKGGGTSPDSGGTTPDGRGTTPFRGGTTPNDRGTTPFRRGTTPDSGGTTPPALWNPPDAGGTTPLAGLPSSTGALRTTSPSQHHRMTASLCVHALPA
jgi:hypothetical protein